MRSISFANSALYRFLIFFLKHVFRNTGYLFFYICSFYNPNQSIKTKYLLDERVRELIESGKSLIRLGDGEIYIMNFGSIGYQKYNSRLRAYFFAMVKEYTENSPYLLGVPETYLGLTNKELRHRNLLHCWLPFKIVFQRFFNKDAKYFDAHLFYRTNAFQYILESILSSKKVLFVASDKNWKLVQKKLESRFKVEFIECKAENAFDDFDKLLAQIMKQTRDNKDEYRVVAAAGPASKALVYELSKQGIIGYDLGRGIEILYSENTLETSI